MGCSRWGREWNISEQRSDKKAGEEPFLWLSPPHLRLGTGASISNSCWRNSDTPSFYCSLQMPLFLSHCTANPSVNPPACSLNFRTEAEPPTSCHQQLHHPDHHHHDGLLKILPAPALALYSQGILHKKKSGHATLLLKASRISHLPQRKSLTWSSAPGLHDHYLSGLIP